MKNLIAMLLASILAGAAAYGMNSLQEKTQHDVFCSVHICLK